MSRRPAPVPQRSLFGGECDEDYLDELALEEQHRRLQRLRNPAASSRGSRSGHGGTFQVTGPRVLHGPAREVQPPGLRRGTARVCTSSLLSAGAPSYRNHANCRVRKQNVASVLAGAPEPAARARLSRCAPSSVYFFLTMCSAWERELLENRLDALCIEDCAATGAPHALKRA